MIKGVTSWKPSNSTSNLRVEFPGILGGLPCAPYAIDHEKKIGVVGESGLPSNNITHLSPGRDIHDPGAYRIQGRRQARLTLRSSWSQHPHPIP